MRVGDFKRMRALGEQMYRSDPRSRHPFFGWTDRSAYGYALIRVGEEEEGRRILSDVIREGEALVEAGDERPGVSWDIAGSYAALGDVDNAMAWLEAAFDAGWRHTNTFPQGDALFEQMRDDPRYQAWEERMSEDLARQAAQVRARRGEDLRALLLKYGAR